MAGTESEALGVKCRAPGMEAGGGGPFTPPPVGRTGLPELVCAGRAADLKAGGASPVDVGKEALC